MQVIDELVHSIDANARFLLTQNERRSTLHDVGDELRAGVYRERMAGTAQAIATDTARLADALKEYKEARP